MSQSSHKMREQHWISIVQECNKASKEEGISKRQWLERNNINYHTYYRWQQRLRNEVASELLVVQAKQNTSAIAERQAAQFAEVMIPAATHTSTHHCKTILRCRSIEIELNEDISDQLLMRLIKVLSYVKT